MSGLRIAAGGLLLVSTLLPHPALSEPLATRTVGPLEISLYTAVLKSEGSRIRSELALEIKKTADGPMEALIVRDSTSVTTASGASSVGEWREITGFASCSQTLPWCQSNFDNNAPVSLRPGFPAGAHLHLNLHGDPKKHTEDQPIQLTIMFLIREGGKTVIPVSVGFANIPARSVID